ncbi:MAG: SDR family oxidoreductase, partial [Ignavibacteria bacterium]|nr:SDR family oxidoreductase [Ignavibacteria bacterium]
MMNDKICVVTGASSGIGRVTAEALAELGAMVLIVCRNREKSESTRLEIIRKHKDARVEFFLADLSSQKEIHVLADAIKARYQHIDVLVNNAGGINPKRTLTVDGIEMTFAVNHLAYFLLTNLLLDQLRAASAARVVNVSSDVHRYTTIFFDDLGLERSYTPMKAYCQSKLANILFTHELGRRLRGTNVTTNALHPGSVRTNFGKNLSGISGFYFRAFGPLMRSPAKGAETVIWLATSSDVDGVTGRYFFDKREIRSSSSSYDGEIA